MRCVCDVGAGDSLAGGFADCGVEKLTLGVYQVVCFVIVVAGVLYGKQFWGDGGFFLGPHFCAGGQECCVVIGDGFIVDFFFFQVFDLLFVGLQGAACAVVGEVAALGGELD